MQYADGFRSARCQLGGQSSGIDAAAGGISSSMTMQDHILFPGKTQTIPGSYWRAVGEQ